LWVGVWVGFGAGRDGAIGVGAGLRIIPYGFRFGRLASSLKGSSGSHAGLGELSTTGTGL